MQALPWAGCGIDASSSAEKVSFRHQHGCSGWPVAFAISDSQLFASPQSGHLVWSTSTPIFKVYGLARTNLAESPM